MTRVYQCPNIMPACFPTSTLLFKLRRGEISMIVKVTHMQLLLNVSEILAVDVLGQGLPEGRIPSLAEGRPRKGQDQPWAEK